MKSLKVCFVGVGSIAKRHIRDLRQVSSEQGISLQLDAYRRKATGIEGVDTVYTDIDLIPNNYDLVFITNPTEDHLAALQAFHGKGKHFFIEKPVVSLNHLEEAKSFALREGSIYYVACPLRYNAVIQYIRENIDPTDVISVRSISSSYLPDWRPGQDYRKTYSANIAMGGGVSIDLIHEWDYLTYLFGWPERVQSFIGKKSDLEIDSDDYAIYIAEFKDKIAELHLDYFGRKTVRKVELFTKDDTIICNIANNEITFLRDGKTITFDEDRDTYQQRELNQFLKIVQGEGINESDFTHGLRLLALTKGQL